ncbi:helix-turn-helix transcriptional regulator [Micromonospora psammae]|uniref:helix-turn-helix transcriptional regulator n=1 Tax=Micromonospora sp. CPCC 205556 TaxID=3122398 RepID=UPI002FF2427F
MWAGAEVVVRAGPSVVGYPPGSRYGPRLLTDFELVWLLAGEARWSWRHAGHRGDLELRPGQLVLARPGVHDEFRWSTRRPTRHGYVHFTLPVDADQVAWPWRRRLTDQDPINALLRYLLWLGGHHGATHPRVAQVVGAVVDLFVHGPVEEPPPVEHGPVDRLLDAVAVAWATGPRPVSLTELGRACATSPAHLSRTFTARYGTSVGVALELVRLALAADLLNRSDLSVAQVARGVGFDDPLYFSRRFRLRFGLAPSAWRAGGRDPRVLLDQWGLGPLAWRLTERHS